MCGLALALGRPLPEDRVKQTLSVLARRGPDASGVYRGKTQGRDLTLLHTRLSIIDLEARSNQPMEFDSCVLVFNGEIYNFIELRHELKKMGHCFETASDSEVIIKAYRQWGRQFVERLEGMWAFALYDQYKDVVLLSRDRFGEKPLFIYETEEAIYAASEVKALATISGQRLEANEDQIRRYLVNGYRSIYKTTENYFRHIKEVPRATVVTLDSNKVAAPQRYWQLDYTPTPITEQDAIEQLKDHLSNSLVSRLRADVPIAFCLSGGIDSTVLASYAVKHLDQEIHTFSLLDKDSRYNELDNIEQTTKHLGCENTQIEICSTGFWERLETLVDYHDAPVATISYYIHSLISEAIHSSGYKVAVSGTAADELFTGYYDHYNYWLAEHSGLPEFDRLLSDWKEGYGVSVRNPVLKNPIIFKTSPTERGHIYLDRDRFNELMVEPLQEEFVEETYSENLLRNRMMNELFNEVVPVILREDDLNSMYWSVENRSPFLDSKLVEFAYSLPNRLLINNGFAKWLLRSAGKDFAPEGVMLDKRKRGFNASIDTLVDRNEQQTKERLLDDSPIFNIVNRQKMEEFITGDFYDNSFSKFLFSFISAKMFLELAEGA